MKRTALFASIALVAGLATPAFAQEIAGTTVSAEDWPQVEAYCADLGELNNPEASENEPTTTQELETSTIDLSLLTRDDCVDAGLVDGGPDAGMTMEAPSTTDAPGEGDDAQ